MRSPAIGITNQRETTLWDRARAGQRTTPSSGGPPHRRPLRPCGRRAGALPSSRTGLVLDPTSPAPRWRGSWTTSPVCANGGATAIGAFGTVDAFLVHRLTGGRAVTDGSNASRTLRLRFAHAGAGRSCGLLVPGGAAAGRAVAGRGRQTAGVPGLPDGIPIAGIAGDQQAALFGQLCRHPAGRPHLRHRRSPATQYRSARCRDLAPAC